MNIKEKILQTKKNGYVILGNNYFDSVEIKKLKELSRKTFLEKKLINHFDYMSPKGGFEGLRYLTQYNDEVHNILNNFFDKKSIKEFLKNILGSKYKIWTINYRVASNSDKGLSFHQDSYGETNLTILLKDNFSGQGSTTFIPGSHLIKHSLKKNNIKIPLFLSNFLKPFSTNLKGKEGQVSLFFNKVWHGRTSNISKQNYDAILISLFPSGATYGSEESGQWQRSYLDHNKGSYLSKLIDPNIYTEKINDYTYKVDGDNQESYSKNLYDMKIQDVNIYYYISLFLFYLLLLFSKIFNPLLSVLKSKE